MISIARRMPVALCAIAALILAGCGSHEGVSVSGKVVFPPSVKLIDSDTAQITFFPAAPSAAGKAAGANIAIDGSFVCRDVLPGKYRLVVNVIPYPGSAGQAKRAALFDRLDRTYGEKNSKLTEEVATNANEHITVDLAKGTVTKD